MRSELVDELRGRLDRQSAFLSGAGPGLLVFAAWRDMYRDIPWTIDDWPSVASADAIFKSSRKIGQHTGRQAPRLLERQLAAEDDSILGWRAPTIDWGTGATAAMFTGLDPVFHPMTSYSPRHVVDGPEDVEQLRLELDNPWIQADIEYWRGFFETCEGPFPVTVHNYRSPLDLANDLRGNAIFTDIYDCPDTVTRLLAWCTESILEVDAHIRRSVAPLQTQPGGCWGVGRWTPGMLFLNGDPVDLVSVDMGERFSHPYVERLGASCGGVYFHHHSIGIDRAQSIGAIPGLAVQEIIQDPNGPRIADRINDALINASLRAPIHLHSNVANWTNVDELLHRLTRGRFIVQVETTSLDEAQRWVARIRSAG